MQSMKQAQSVQMDGNPRISVIMGVLCREERTELLRRSVSSILEQSFEDFEFLICDDGSAAEAMTVLEGYAAEDPRIRLIRPGDKLDLASKLNACLQSARGDFIARMDDDDRAFPERFQKQVEALDADPGITFAGCCVWLVRRGERCGKRMLPEYPQVKDFYMTQPFIHPALLFRKAALEEVNGYSEGTLQVLCEDYDLLLRLYARGYRGRNLQEPLLEYTIPDTAKGNRRMSYRWNETVTRWARFRELGVLPEALPYVVKPLVVGMLPDKLLRVLKERKN